MVMIASLRGVVSDKDAEQIVLEVGGVGYGLLVSVADFNTLIVGNEAKLHVYEHIREDTHDLFGFIAPDTKRLFQQLLSVKNVGPKVALAVLGVGTAAIVRSAIAGGDVKLLQTAKGVGKRAAEQIIVELRDKVGLAAGIEAEQIVSRGGVNMADEAIQALVALGFSEIDAQLALQDVPTDASTEERIKQALKR